MKCRGRVAPGSQVFSRTNGVHSGTIVSQHDAAAGIGSRADFHDQDQADGVYACLKKDGGSLVAGNIPRAGYKLPPSASGDSANKGYVDNKTLTGFLFGLT